MKPYDLKVLAEKLKSKGMNVAEESLKILVSETLDWIHESAPLSPSKIDDVLVMAIPFLKPKVLESIDKIDGEQG